MINPRLIFAAVLCAGLAACGPAAVATPTAPPVQAPTVAPTQTATPTPTPTEAPTASQSPAPTPALTVAPSSVLLPRSGPLSPGSYYIADTGTTSVQRVTFTVPAGWVTADYGFLSKDEGTSGEVSLNTWVLTHVFVDACKWDEAKIVDVGTTPAQLMAALTDQKSREASPAQTVDFAGYPAQQMVLTVAPDLDVSTCTDGNLRYWPGPGPDFSSGLCCNPAGNIDTVYAVDVNGKRLVVVARHYPGSSAANIAELQGIVDSMQIQP